MKLNVDHPLVDQILNRLYVQGDVGLYLINAIQDTYLYVTFQNSLYRIVEHSSNFKRNPSIS